MFKTLQVISRLDGDMTRRGPWGARVVPGGQLLLEIYPHLMHNRSIDAIVKIDGR